MISIGLTGGLASGKSTVARWLAEAGCVVVDGDRLVAELYRAGEPGTEAVVELFGDSVLDGEGNVNKLRLAARVFGAGAEPAALERLEAAVHPLVRARFAEIAEVATAQGAAAVVLEATRLVEAGYAPDFDVVITIEADSELRLARAVARGLEEDDARSRLSAQGTGEPRQQAAHRILLNDGSLAELRGAVDALLVDLEIAPAAEVKEPEDES